MRVDVDIVALAIVLLALAAAADVMLFGVEEGVWQGQCDAESWQAEADTMYGGVAYLYLPDSCDSLVAHVVVVDTGKVWLLNYGDYARVLTRAPLIRAKAVLIAKEKKP